MTVKVLIQLAIETAIVDGREIVTQLSVRGKRRPPDIDPHVFSRWLSDCRNLLRLIGDKSKSFSDSFKDGPLVSSLDRCKSMLGALESLLGAVNRGLLVNIENLVSTDNFAKLLERADELRGEGHCLAAGVICHAVFEGHLRRLYEIHRNLEPEILTIEEMIQELKQSEVFTKISAMNVVAILSQGNHCTHNKQPPINESDIRGMIHRVRNFLLQHPLR